ncbi:MAG TPA: cytochrome c3 family protein, partial [Ignavibacteriaceae bacterium]
MKTFYSVLVLVSASVLFITAFTGKNSGDPVLTNKDLINFSHSIHSELVSCADCHSTVASSTSLKDRLLPNHESCESCHDVSNDQECSTCHKNDNYQPLIQTASTLLFNHSIHITDSKTCTDCHKGLD